MRRRAATPIAAVLAAGLLVAGCGTSDADSDRQARVVTTVASEEDTSTLTPLERGKIRREALAVAEAGMAAWLAGDADTLARYYSADLVQEERDKQAAYAAEGKTRVRVHSATHMDLIDLNQTGDQALVEYLLTDDSYFAGPDGTPLAEPTHKETEIQLTMELDDDGRWWVIRVIGGTETLQ